MNTDQIYHCSNCGIDTPSSDCVWVMHPMYDKCPSCPNCESLELEEVENDSND